MRAHTIRTQMLCFSFLRPFPSLIPSIYTQTILLFDTKQDVYYFPFPSPLIKYLKTIYFWLSKHKINIAEYKISPQTQKHGTGTQRKPSGFHYIICVSSLGHNRSLETSGINISPPAGSAETGATSSAWPAGGSGEVQREPSGRPEKNVSIDLR